MEIKSIIEESFKTAEEKGWHEVQKSFPDRIALMHSELSEALEEYRNNHSFSEIYFVEKPEGQKPEGIAVELADAIIRICEACAVDKIPLEEALELKMAFNKLRPYLHGGKKI